MLQTLLGEHSAIYRDFGRSAAKNLWVLVGCLLKGRTTNLNRLKDYVSDLLEKPMTDPESHYKRLLRFFQGFAQPEFVASVLGTAYGYLQGQSRFLLLDGSSWQIGQRKVHFLTLSSLLHGVAVPVAWQELGHWGSSDQAQRQAFLEAIGQRLDLKGQILLADREYVGRQWLHYLHQQGIDFVIRLRMADYAPELRAATGWSWPVVVAHALSHRQPWAIEIRLGGTPLGGTPPSRISKWQSKISTWPLPFSNWQMENRKWQTEIPTWPKQIPKWQLHFQTGGPFFGNDTAKI